jgi:GT2 family glycosyltransferase
LTLPTPAGPTVTVIIPTYRRYAYLRDVLTDLSVQTVPPAQVVVVDQTEDRRRESDVIDAFADRLAIQTITLRERGTCVSRNAGLAVATSPLVLLLDDDIRFGPSLVEEHLRVLDETGAGAVHGAVLPPDKASEELPRRNENWDAGWALMASPNVPYRTACIGVAGGNLLIRKEMLAKVRGFDEWFNNGAGDDFDLGVRLFRAGVFVVFDPAPAVTHLRAQTGGRREAEGFGSRFTSLLRREPPPQIFYLYMKHFPGWGARLQLWLYLGRVFSRKNLKHPWVFVFGPIRVLRSWFQAKRMSASGPRYADERGGDAR